MTALRTAVITPVAGRREHFLLQQAGLGRSKQRIDHRVVVAMGEGRVDGLEPTDQLVRVEAGARLPLARARNIGAQAAIAAGAELLVFLDVDCVPVPELIGHYQSAAGLAPDDVLCGPVHYLDPPRGSGYDLDQLPWPPHGHPARPVPEGGLLRHGDHTLFWSLSFAVLSSRWTRIGGFDERYDGYGGEDTDLGQRARSAGVGLSWVGEAWAYHQHHPTSDPPVQHVDDILRNARLFRDIWGWWPMGGWLESFERLGLIRWDSVDDRWQRTAAPYCAG